MAASVLCRRVPRLRHLPGLRKELSQAQQHAHAKQVDDADDEEGKKGAPQQHQEASLLRGYRLYYNPSSYHSLCNSATSRSQPDNDDDECLSTLTPSFWQQSNRYSVSCSRHLSSSKNTLLNLAFSKGPGPEMPPVPPYQRKPVPPDVKVDTRAFLKCRPEYAHMSLDLTRRPHPIEWDDAMLVLKKVAALRGSMKPSDVSRFLGELSRLPPDKTPLVRSDQRFSMLLRYSVEHLRLFTPLELLEVLRSFAWLAVPPAHTVLGLYEAELCGRAGQMTLHQLLLAADLWHCIRRPVPQFLRCLYDSLHRHHGQIGVPELVQLLYTIGEARRCPKDMVSPVEQLLMRHLHDLYPEEVGTVFLGLFKSQTSLSEGAVLRIFDKAHSFVEEMSDLAVVNVMKYLRFSYLSHRAWLEAMSREVPRRAHRMGIKGLMHVALACSALHYRNEKVFMAIGERVPSLVPHCRSKDTSKLLWAFGTFGFLPVQIPSFYQSLTEALRQGKGQFQQYPEHLLTALLGLAFVSEFPEDLIALALSPEFVSLAVKSKQLDLKKDLFTLDGTVALELPQWTGPRLSRELREETTEMLWAFAQSDVCQKLEVLEAESTLQALLGGEKFVCKRMILPHLRSIDLEVHIDAAGQPVPVNPTSGETILSPESRVSKIPSHEDWGKMDTGVTITDDLLAQLMNTKNITQALTLPSKVKPTSLPRVRRDRGRSLLDSGLYLSSDITEALIRPISQPSAPQEPKGTVKLAIQVSNRSQYCYQSQRLVGLHAMKRRQLELAGYRVVELSHQNWFPMLRKSRAEKMAYLHCIIYDSL